MKTRLIDGVDLHRGSGNVFAGLDPRNAETLKIKANEVCL